MEKARKPWWVKLIIAILSIIIIIALAFAGACIFVKVKYNVRLEKLKNSKKMLMKRRCFQINLQPMT